MAVATPSGICPRCGKPMDEHAFRDRSYATKEVWTDPPRCPPVRSKQEAA